MKRVFPILLLLLSIILQASAQSSNVLFEEIGLNKMRAEFGLMGEGTAVAIFDRGIDYRHPDFIDENGKTRILGIWDLSDNSGANHPNNPYQAGTIYTEEMINEALSSGDKLATRDASGHGTVTAGIAVGDGATSTFGIQGIAPKARIIVVKITSEGAPAHDDQPAEFAFYAGTFLGKAIKWTKSLAEEKGLPVSMIANFGSIQGPMDGTSRDSRSLDSLFTEDDPGYAFVCGSSDDGLLKNHASTVLKTGEAIEFKINKQTQAVRFDMWYSNKDQIEIEIISPGGSLIMPALSDSTRSENASTSDFTVFHQGSDFDFFGADNSKNEILIDFYGANGDITIKLNPIAIEEGKWDATLNPSNIVTGSRNEFSDFAVDGTIWDIASSKNNICPNSYIISNDWQSASGGTFSYPGHENGIGSLWTGSGIGPTFDGRIGIDVSVPGNINFGAYAPDSYFASFPANVVEAGDYPYGFLAAVSGANPVLAGVIALMFEANPTLTTQEIKQILRKTARTDEFTGEVPNNKWGYGKLDAYAAIQEILDPVSVENIRKDIGISVSPNPSRERITVKFEKRLEKEINLTIVNIMGKSVKQISVLPNQLTTTIDISELQSGIYYLTTSLDDDYVAVPILKN